MGTNKKVYKDVPTLIIMVYHEIRIVNRKKKNYLVSNNRNNNKWIKKSKFIGSEEISKEKIKELIKNFEKQNLVEKKYKFLSEKQIKEIEDLREVYSNEIENLHKEEYEKFEESFFTELTYDSNAIEGSSLSLEDTNLILNEGIVPKGKTLREIYEAKNHLEALNFIKQYKGDLDEKLILKIHSIILKDISKRFAGKYRKTNVRIAKSNVKLPLAEVVPQLIKNLIHWYKKNKSKYHPFELATLISMKFVTIHPFVDGNGRVSRLLMNFLLKKKKYPWINIYKRDREDYLKAVRKANDEKYNLIFPFLIKSLRKNLKRLDILI